MAVPIRGTAAPMTTPANNRLPLLDGMRGIAAVSVLFYHETSHFGPRGLIAHGYLAVDFFLLLSGFVLARTFEPRFVGGLSMPKFMGQRLRRLWPLMGLGTGLGATLALIVRQEGNLAWLLACGLVFVPQLGRAKDLYPLNGPQWSLLTELLANIAHGAVLWRLRRRWVLLGAAACALGLLRAALHYGTFDLGALPAMAWGGPLRAGFAYGLGIVLARTLDARGTDTAWGWLAPIVLLPGLIVLPALPEIAALPQSPRLGVEWLVIVAGLPGVLVLALRTGAPARAAPLLHWLGRLSFPLYAVHLPLLGFGEWLGDHDPAHGGAIRLGTLVVTIGTAALLAETALGGRPARRTASAPALATAR